MRRLIRATLTAGLTLAVTVGAPAAARADDTVVVAGTAFPSGDTYLTYFGCVDLYHADTRGPAVRVARDEAAPLGSRAAALQLPGTGTAAGSVSLVGSVAEATHALTVRATAGSSGVAYVWYVAPGLHPGEVWAGRADLAATGDGWQRLDAAAATYEWSRLDAATGTVTEQGGAAPIDAFTAEHGDGPGYLMAGLGCDGGAFDLDAIAVGAPGAITTYDLEGWSVSTSIAAGPQRILPGGEAMISAVSVDAAGEPMGAALVLEARPAGAGSFRAVTDSVLAGPDGTVSVKVAPEVTTDYRWHFAERAYADGHWSDTVRIVVD